MPGIQQVGADQGCGIRLVMTDVGMKAAQATQAGCMLRQLSMPVLDGFHFLSYLMDHGFDLPVLLSNAPDSEAARGGPPEPARPSLLALRPAARSSAARREQGPVLSRSWGREVLVGLLRRIAVLASHWSSKLARVAPLPRGPRSSAHGLIGMVSHGTGEAGAQSPAR